MVERSRGMRFWLVLVCVGACKGKAVGPALPAASASVAVVDAPPPPDAARVRAVWTGAIANEDDFLRYSKEVGTDRFTKFVIDLSSKAIYYVDAELYPMHKDFVFAELLKEPRTKEAERLFDRNYGKDKPSFLMCYLVHHLVANEWSLAFWDGDKATAAHVRLAFERMRATFYLGERVKFRPNSNDQEAVAAEVKEIPVLTNDALYKAAGYQPFHPGVAVGTLRIVKDGRTAFDPGDIVILPEPLTDITPVAGIVSESFSTPLSHVNLRAAAWDVPNVGWKGASRTYAGLDGQVVRFEAGATSASIRRATAAEVAAAKRARRTTVQVPKADLAVTALTGLDGLRATDASAYGSKTANLGEIVHAAPAGFTVPNGFGIPIAHYVEHLAAAKVDERRKALRADPRFASSMEFRRTSLEELRRQIRDAPLTPAFVATLHDALVKLGAGDSGLFVRSSTNAEDLEGFSGAGLYDTVPNVHGEEAVGAAVKKVWASVWNLAAYEERALYGIDQEHVYGAVLVQVGVPATAAGVLVTAHPTDPNDTKTFTINAKSGLGMRVVDGKKLPEIVLYNTFNRGLRVVSRSDEDTMLVFHPDGGVAEVPNPKKSAPILTNLRVTRLATAAEKLRAIFPKPKALDVEWVLKDDDVFIVQARPYLATPAAGPRALP